jgi:hypothetical protein
MLKERLVSRESLPDLQNEFGYVLERNEWIPINWRHNAIASSGAPIGEVKRDDPVPFYCRQGKYAYPILHDAKEDFYRAGSVGAVKERDPTFNNFYSAVASNADAIFVPRELWEDVKRHKKRNEMGRWMVIHCIDKFLEAGYVGKIGRTRIYTDARFAANEQLFDGKMFVLKIHPGVKRLADPMVLDRIIVVKTERGNRLMMERDLSNQHH